MVEVRLRLRRRVQVDAERLVDFFGFFKVHLPPVSFSTPWIHALKSDLVRLFRHHLPIHEGILDARVLLNQMVLAQLEVVVFQLVERPGVIVSAVEVAQLRLLLRNLRGRPLALIGVPYSRVFSQFFWKLGQIL